MGIRLGIPIAAETRLESGCTASSEDTDVRNIYARFEAPNCRGFAGSGEPRDWRALRIKPYQGAFTASGCPWSIAEGDGRASLLFAFESGGLRFFTRAIPESGDIPVIPASLGDAIGAALRIGGIEIAIESGALIGAVSASLSDRPPEDPGDGWRAGSNGTPGSSLFTVSSAVEVSARDFKAGFWVSGSAGYLVTPGLAASFGGEATIRLGGSDRQNVFRALGISAFLFGAGSGFRISSGELVPYDFVADVTASLKGASWTLAAKLSVRSFSDEVVSGPIRRVRGGNSPSLESCLWYWRTDIARVGLDLRFRGFSLAARIAADGGAMRNGSIDFRVVPPETDETSGVKVSVSARIGFVRKGISGDEDEDESDPDNSGGGEIQADAWRGEGIAGGFEMRSMKAGCRLSWGKGISARWIGRGSAEFALSSIGKDQGYDFAFTGSLSLTMGISGKFESTLTLKSPEGGYALDVFPDALPNLAIEFSIPLV